MLESEHETLSGEKSREQLTPTPIMSGFGSIRHFSVELEPIIADRTAKTSKRRVVVLWSNGVYSILLESMSNRQRRAVKHQALKCSSFSYPTRCVLEKDIGQLLEGTTEDLDVVKATKLCACTVAV